MARRRAARAQLWVVTDRGDTEYFDTDEDMEEMIRIWKDKGRVTFYVFRKEGVRK